MVVTIVVIVGIIGIGVGILAYRNRTEKGIESGITSFRRELHALAPRPGEERSAPERPAADARSVTIMPDETDEAESDAEPESVDDAEGSAPDVDVDVDAPATSDDVEDDGAEDSDAAAVEADPPSAVDAPATDTTPDPTDTDERPDA